MQQGSKVESIRGVQCIQQLIIYYCYHYHQKHIINRSITSISIRSNNVYFSKNYLFIVNLSLMIII